jgi:hypothetical protein
MSIRCARFLLAAAPVLVVLASADATKAVTAQEAPPPLVGHLGGFKRIPLPGYPAKVFSFDFKLGGEYLFVYVVGGDEIARHQGTATCVAFAGAAVAARDGARADVVLANC